MNWFVLYTKPNFELKVANGLNALGIHAYCPVVHQLKEYSDRKKKVIRPILPSYVLVKLEEKNRNKVFEVSGVVCYVYWLGRPAIVREEEIELMKNSLNGVYNNIILTKLNIGSAVTLSKGPFKGQKGKVVQLYRNRLKLELPSLGVSVTLKTA